MLPTIIALCLAFAPMPDFDGDGDVDQSDFGALQIHLGEQAEPVCIYDLNSDGWVDQNDVSIFLGFERKAKR